MKIGIVDTTFSRVNMGEIAIEELGLHPQITFERRTVPGIKDLAVECKRLLEGVGTGDGKLETGNPIPACDIVLALGMVGGAPIDTQCAHEASLGIQQAKLLTNKHIIEVFVHENEAWSGEEFIEICQSRIRKHVQNALLMITKPETLSENAGMGVRQGKKDEGKRTGSGSITLGIVTAQFNSEITEKMSKEAQKIAREKGAETFNFEVPGVYDMPILVKKLLMDKNLDGIVTLGAVVKGDTAHDEVITKDVARRLGDLSLEFRKPVTLGIIGHGVGWDAAVSRKEEYAQRATEAVIYMIKLLRK